MTKKQKIMSRKKLRYSSARITFIISYLLVMALSMTSIFFLFSYTRSLSQKQLENITETALHQARDNMEQIILNVNNVSRELAMRDGITKLRFYEEPLSVQQRFDIYSAINNEMSHVSTWYGIDDILLYYAKGDFVLNSRGKNTSDVIHQSYFSHVTIDEDEFHRIISQPANRGKAYSVPQGLFLVQSIPYNQKYYLNVVAFVSNASMLKNLASSQWVKEGLLLVYSKEGELVFSSSEDQQYELLEDNKALYHGNNTIYASCTDDNGWSFVLVMSPEEQNRLEVNTTRVFVLYVSLFALLAVFLAILFTRHNYKPISKLVDKIGEKGTEEAKNEYDLIDSAVDQILDEGNAAQMEAKQKEKYYQRRIFMTRLIQKQLNMALITQERMDDYGLSISPQHGFMICIFPILDSTRYYAHRAPVSHTPSTTMIEQVEDFLFEEIRPKRVAYSCEINGMLTFLINLTAEDRKAYQGFQAQEEEKRSLQNSPVAAHITTVVEKLENDMGVRTIAYCGEPHNNIHAIPAAFEEAMSMYYRQFHKTEDVFTEKICFYETTSNLLKMGISIEMEQAIQSNILYGNVSEVQSLMNEAIHSIYEQKEANIAKLSFNSLLMVLLRVLEKMEEVEQYELEARLLRLSSDSIPMGQRCEELKMAANELTLYMDEKKNSSSQPLLKEILSYLQRNFANPNLSNTMIADAVGISTAYLSRFFKSQTGDKLTNYLIRLRIDAAKEILLANREIDNSLVGKDVGFESVSTFIRSFKKVEGITPGQYRELNFGVTNQEETENEELD